MDFYMGGCSNSSTNEWYSKQNDSKLSRHVKIILGFQRKLGKLFIPSGLNVSLTSTGLSST